MKAMNEFGAVLVLAAVIVGACIATTPLPLWFETGSTSGGGVYPGNGMQLIAVVPPQE